MLIQFQLAQQCIQISTRINSSSVHTYIFVCFTLRVILQGFVTQNATHENFWGAILLEHYHCGKSKRPMRDRIGVLDPWCHRLFKSNYILQHGNIDSKRKEFKVCLLQCRAMLKTLEIHHQLKVTSVSLTNTTFARLCP